MGNHIVLSVVCVIAWRLLRDSRERTRYELVVPSKSYALLVEGAGRIRFSPHKISIIQTRKG